MEISFIMGKASGLMENTGELETSGCSSEVGRLPKEVGSNSEVSTLPKEVEANSEVSNLPKEVETSSLSGDMRMDVRDDALPEDGRKDKGESHTEDLSVEEKQMAANEAAKLYNSKFQPYERACQKGVEGVSKTANGGVSFEHSDAIYRDKNGNTANVQIEATGNRSSDFDAANKAVGLQETPEGYVWHHMDDYDVKTNTVSMQLVKDDAHNATKPHSGGCAQYDAAHGPTYNPPRKDVG